MEVGTDPGSSETTTQTDMSRTNIESRTTPYSYLHLLSRITTYVQPLPASESMPSHDYTRILALLLLQPLEIRQLILKYMTPTSLLSLRQTSRTLHELVHSSEKGLCLSLIERTSKFHSLSGITIAVSNLAAYVRISRQNTAIGKLAQILAETIGNVLTRTFVRAGDGYNLQIWRQRKSALLGKRLARALIILQQYLNFFLETLMSNERHLTDLDDNEYTDLSHVFDFDQQRYLSDHMSGLTEQDFVDVVAATTIFKAICKARFIPFNLKSVHSPFVSVRQILIYKGLSPFADLLAEGTILQRQKALIDQLSKSIGTVRRSGTLSLASRALDTLHCLAGYAESRDAWCDNQRSSKARDTFLQRQDIWDRSARAFMMQKLRRYPSVQPLSVWIPRVVAEDEREREIHLGKWDQIQRPA